MQAAGKVNPTTACPTVTSSFCARNIFQLDGCAKKKKKKKRGKSGQPLCRSQTRRKHVKKLAATLQFLPLKHAGWRRQHGRRLCYCAGEKGNSPFSLPRCLDTRGQKVDSQSPFPLFPPNTTHSLFNTGHGSCRARFQA